MLKRGVRELGREPQTYWNPLFLRHVLAGIQFATGDLAVPE